MELGISRDEFLNEMTLDEFLTILDEYNEMHKLKTGDDGEQPAVTEVTAEEW